MGLPTDHKTSLKIVGGRVSKGNEAVIAINGNAAKERRGDEGASKRWMRCPNIPARVILGIVSFFGFFTNQMLRVNINIAIVAMVNTTSHSTQTPKNLTTTALLQGSVSESFDMLQGTCISLLNSKSNGHARTNGFHEFNSTGNNEEATDGLEVFSWDSIEQGMVLGAFYWTYVVSLVPGAMLANVIGPKLVFGGANLLTALLALLTPLAARTGFVFLLLIRILQGFASGVIWPTMNTMASRWIPPHERSKFISTYLGSSVGSAVAYPLCGALIDHYGWPSAFYVPGVMTCAWFVFWWFLAFDTPNIHPRISRSEQVYIETAVSPSLNKEKMPTPWKKMFQSVPFWALVVANLGSLWGFMTILSYGPTYLNNIHGFSMKENGIFSGLPNIMRFIVSIIYSSITDHMIRMKTFSVTVIRKVSTCVVELLPGLLFLFMTNIGCNAAAEVALLTLAAGFNGATSSGPLANSMDLAPNFAGLILAMISVVSMSTGFLIPSITGAIINNNNTIDGWRWVFVIGAAVSILCSLVFAIFGSGEVQDWNWPSGKARATNGQEGDKEEDDDMQDHTPALRKEKEGK
ncbi:sialin-like [Ischnura elegans]|uniref:sialin-like n=1 Tax=Ischnura elegans TaxID=197161 RepID=UPI001ED8B581|nr:sialin-like [Ischnura elegans]